MSKTNPFIFKEEKLDHNKFLYMIDIEDLNELGQYIDDNIIKICKGKREVKLETVKKELLDYLNSKVNSNLFTGSVAEFFIHLFLGKMKFKQEFLYFNLEENSIKKGFDGYYTKEDEQWILESKSGVLSSSNKITHSGKITEAYNGLKAKIEGTDNVNNPWENAYNHAAHLNVKSNRKITDIINKLSQDYSSKKYRQVKEFNVIPCSTLFLEKDWSSIDKPDLIMKITDNISTKDFSKIIVVCINKKSLNSLIEYLKL